MELVQKVNNSLENAQQAFLQYRKSTPAARADFMRTIAVKLSDNRMELVKLAMQETNLQESRLISELKRTVFQLNSYAEACEKGLPLEARINRSSDPSKPDIRKMLVPLGPVVVFGASNFPFAYSTAGGDTACAFAAGCPVIVKAHPAHPLTGNFVADIISASVAEHRLPAGIFSHIHGGEDVGEALVKHPLTKAVGFTGSLKGGRQLFDWGNQRPVPVPVFAEMGSVNPVFLLPRMMAEAASAVAGKIAASITNSVGQFCTNPGLIIGIDNKHLDQFIRELSIQIRETEPAPMLHPGIYKNYVEKRGVALGQQGIETVAVADKEALYNEGTPTLATTTAKIFINEPLLQQEVFGPFSLVIRCKDLSEMLEVASILEGQLTASVAATKQDVYENPELMDTLKDICGRFIMNGVPTGVEVCLSMHHGGPYPATTDSRFTSVGADGIKRFARPVAFQNWPDELLPDELKDNNPLNIMRIED